MIKQLLTIIIFLGFMLFGFAQTTQNNNLKSAGEYNANGEKEGEWNYYNDNGELVGKGRFINGKKEGEWRWELNLKRGEYLIRIYKDGKKEQEWKKIKGRDSKNEPDKNGYYPQYLRGICEHVITPDLVDGELSYITRFKNAAGITPEDSEEEMYRKIREVWTLYEDRLVCDTIAFSLVGGNILKAATVSRNEGFYNAVIKWGVNLNRIDPVDGKTVLDFFRDKIATHPPNIDFYEAYYLMLKHYGAKHASDILAVHKNH